MSDRTNTRAVLRAAEVLKGDSRTMKDSGDLPAAAATLDRAIELLKPELARRAATDSRRAAVGVPQETRKMAGELADCYGSLGGILRRQGCYEKALESYDHGRALEQNEMYKLNNSYNQVQWIVLRILRNPNLLATGDAPLADEIDRASELIERQMAAGRKDVYWALADRYLLKILRGDKAGADRVWEQLDKPEVIPDIFKSGLPVLEDLRKLVSGHKLLTEAIENFESRIGPARRTEAPHDA